MGAHPDVSYFYFGRNLWSRHRGVVTAGVIPDYEAGTAKVAFAFCSPLDAFRRFSEPSTMAVRKHIEDPASPGRHVTVTEQVPNPAPKPGGADIVNARLGLVPDAPVKGGCLEVPLVRHSITNRDTGEIEEGYSLMHTAIVAFNRHLPAAAKPRIWKRRKLVFGSPLALALSNAASYAEAMTATALLWHKGPEPVMGFVPSPARGL